MLRYDPYGSRGLFERASPRVPQASVVVYFLILVRVRHKVLALKTPLGYFETVLSENKLQSEGLYLDLFRINHFMEHSQDKRFFVYFFK